MCIRDRATPLSLLDKDALNDSMVFASLPDRSITVSYTHLDVYKRQVISLYDNVRENTPRDDNLTGILEDDLQLFTIAMAKTLDSNFEAVSFDDSVDEQTRQIFLDVFDDYLKGITSLFNNDGDFIYKAVNTNTNQMISQHSEKITTNDDQSKYSFYTEASYDQNGDVYKRQVIILLHGRK